MCWYTISRGCICTPIPDPGPRPGISISEVVLELEVEPRPHTMGLKRELERPVEPVGLWLAREEEPEPVRLGVVELTLERPMEPVGLGLALE